MRVERCVTAIAHIERDESNRRSADTGVPVVNLKRKKVVLSSVEELFKFVAQAARVCKLKLSCPR